MRLYICVLDSVPDYMVPTLVAHTMLGAHLEFSREYEKLKDNELGSSYCPYFEWLTDSFKKCVVRVNKKEFDKISEIPLTYLGHENSTLGGMKTCAIPIPTSNDKLPNVLRFAKLWRPMDNA